MTERIVKRLVWLIIHLPVLPIIAVAYLIVGGLWLCAWADDSL